MNKKLDHINANWKLLALLCYKFFNFYQYSVISPVPVIYGRSSVTIWWFWKYRYYIDNIDIDCKKYWYYRYRISCKNNTTILNGLFSSIQPIHRISHLPTIFCFPTLIQFLGKRRFEIVEDLEVSVTKFFWNKDIKFYRNGIQNPTPRYVKCIFVGRHHVEK